MMDPQAWVWRSIGLVVVAVAVVIALWFTGQVVGAIGSVTFATPSTSASPSATAAITSQSASPSNSGLQPSPSPSAKQEPSPTPTR